MEQRIAVIGSGISGISCAYHLLKNGCKIALYGKDYGGWLKTVGSKERGARLIKNDKESRHFWELVEAAGLCDQIEGCS